MPTYLPYARARRARADGVRYSWLSRNPGHSDERKSDCSSTLAIALPRSQSPHGPYWGTGRSGPREGSPGNYRDGQLAPRSTAANRNGADQRQDSRVIQKRAKTAEISWRALARFWAIGPTRRSPRKASSICAAHASGLVGGTKRSDS